MTTSKRYFEMVQPVAKVCETSHPIVCNRFPLPCNTAVLLAAQYHVQNLDEQHCIEERGANL